MNDDQQERRLGSDDIGRLLRLAEPRPKVPADRAERVRHNLKAAWRAEIEGDTARPPKWRLWGGMLATSALAAAVVIFLLFGEQNRRDLEPQRLAAKVLLTVGEVTNSSAGVIVHGTELLEDQVLETAVDSSAALRLADGALVRIDANSQVEIHDGRRVTLVRGRLYADCGIAATSSLEIRTSKGVVTDIGTQFSVAEEAGGSLIIRVREGSTRLSGELGVFTTEAGRELSIDRYGENIHTRAIPSWGPDWQWILNSAPPLEIEGRTLGVFLDWVERETGWHIELPQHGPELREIELFGSIDGLRPDEAPAAVLPTCGLDYDLIDGTLWVRSSGS